MDIIGVEDIARIGGQIDLPVLDSEEDFDPAELKLLPVLASGRSKNQIAQ